MRLEEVSKGDVLVSVDRNGAGYYRVIRVNRVTVTVRGENGNIFRAYPHVFDRKVDRPIGINI